MYVSVWKTCDLLQLYQKESGRSWTKTSTDGNLKFDATDLRAVFVEMTTQERHRNLSDFDDHLNDITRSAFLLWAMTAMLFCPNCIAKQVCSTAAQDAT